MWFIYTTEYYSTIKRNTFDSVLTRRMNLEPIIYIVKLVRKRKTKIIY